MGNRSGKLIVFEGTDGTGKTTQSKLLSTYLEKNKIPNVSIKFPRYEESEWAKIVRRYLLGEFGKLDDVNPYLVSLAYAGDRMNAASTINKWISSGKIVVCDRYIGSNIAHMAAKFNKETERQKYIEWLENLEYKENGIPKEDLVILLQVPINITKQLQKARSLDIHEGDQKYQQEVFDVYDSVSRKRKNWVRIDSTQNEKILSPQQVHDKIISALKERNLI